MNQITRILLATALFTLAPVSANASIIYTFDVSDVSWAQTVQGDWSDMTFWFEFEFDADLNALTGHEVLAMGFTNGVAQGTFDRYLGGASIGKLFGISGSIASLSVGHADNPGGVLYCSSTICPGRMQVGLGNFTSMIAENTSGKRWQAYAGSSTSSKIYYSSSEVTVSSPGTYTLTGLGLALFALHRRRAAGRKSLSLPNRL